MMIEAFWLIVRVFCTSIDGLSVFLCSGLTPLPSALMHLHGLLTVSHLCTMCGVRSHSQACAKEDSGKLLPMHFPCFILLLNRHELAWQWQPSVTTVKMFYSCSNRPGAYQRQIDRVVSRACPVRKTWYLDTNIHEPFSWVLKLSLWCVFSNQVLGNRYGQTLYRIVLYSTIQYNTKFDHIYSDPCTQLPIKPTTE